MVTFLELYTQLYSNEKNIIPHVLRIIYQLFSLYEINGKEELANNLIFIMKDIGNFERNIDQPFALCLNYAFKGFFYFSFRFLYYHTLPIFHY